MRNTDNLYKKKKKNHPIPRHNKKTGTNQSTVKKQHSFQREL
jgi:hypothetical protein